MQGLSAEERRKIRQQFAVALANLEHVDVYWSTSRRRITSRSVGARLQRLPDDAELVGRYARPFNWNEFLGDLDYLLTAPPARSDAPGTPLLRAPCREVG